MKRSKKISVVMHKLLIAKGMDGFTVVEARNACLSKDGISSDLHDARKQIYRQILRYEKKSWLRCEGTGQQKRYFKTEIFTNTLNLGKPLASIESTDFKSTFKTLSQERSKYQGELEISVGEIEEYKTLMNRFPSIKSKLFPLMKQSRAQSAQLLGKINVLTNVLEMLKEDIQKC
ncbi:hypothetical protein DBZ36_10610 [Alginatibacterium sediminis]|uniref:Response regulator n=1 Tax=Alginatibacterium sediminis TaxID=2164068 RepID=A0A420EDX5_9ALTE|nr:hypothetical protein [Alginatibacterium sediminis]RKF18832.1 hypothetical protein DBZ36_10610 [Alginatibacterium sediminis]